MNLQTPKTTLRLVGQADPAEVVSRARPPIRPAPGKGVLTLAPSVRLADASETELTAEHQRQIAVARANIDASRMSALDARWILAVQVDRALEGGQAAILPPEARARLLTLAERVGLRPFDANLVIAVVQDAARAGEDPLGPLAVDRLRLVREGDASPLYTRKPRSTTRAWVLHAGLVVVLGFGIAYGITRWLLS